MATFVLDILRSCILGEDCGIIGNDDVSKMAEGGGIDDVGW